MSPTVTETHPSESTFEKTLNIKPPSGYMNLEDGEVTVAVTTVAGGGPTLAEFSSESTNDEVTIENGNTLKLRIYAEDVLWTGRVWLEARVSDGFESQVLVIEDGPRNYPQLPIRFTDVVTRPPELDTVIYDAGTYGDGLYA